MYDLRVIKMKIRRACCNKLIIAEWSFTICPTPYKCQIKCVSKCPSLNKTFPSFRKRTVYIYKKKKKKKKKTKKKTNNPQRKVKQ